MPMRRTHEFSQSADKFEREPQGVCQALSARWIVSRALWDPSRDGKWAGGSWMGDKRDMEAHVWRIYSTTRSARAAVAREEQSLMEQETRRFNAEKQQVVKRSRRMQTGAATLNSTALAAAPAAEPTPVGYSPEDLQTRLGRIYIPTLPRMLDALKKDISEHSGLDGTLHTYDNVSPDQAAPNICALGAGYKLIDVRDTQLSSEGGAHAIAAELRAGEARLFDPNFGEWAYEPPGGAWESFGALVQFLLSTGYKLTSIRYLSVIHFPVRNRP